MSVNGLWLNDLPYYFRSCLPGALIISLCVVTILIIAIRSSLEIKKGDKRGTESGMNGDETILWIAHANNDETLRMRKDSKASKGLCEYEKQTGALVMHPSFSRRTTVTTTALVAKAYAEKFLYIEGSRVEDIRCYTRQYFLWVYKAIAILVMVGVFLQLGIGTYGTLLIAIGGLVFPILLLGIIPAVISSKELTERAISELRFCGILYENEEPEIRKIIARRYLHQCIL